MTGAKQDWKVVISGRLACQLQRTLQWHSSLKSDAVYLTEAIQIELPLKGGELRMFEVGCKDLGHKRLLVLQGTQKAEQSYTVQRQCAED